MESLLGLAVAALPMIAACVALAIRPLTMALTFDQIKSHSLRWEATVWRSASLDTAGIAVLHRTSQPRFRRMGATGATTRLTRMMFRRGLVGALRFPARAAFGFALVTAAAFGGLIATRLRRGP